MIVRHFLDWVRTAPAGKRAEATAALARAYLYSDLSPDDAAAAEGAMLILLDDPSPLVRRALADVLAASPSAPPAVMLALAADQPQIAAPVLALSPLFVDADGRCGRHWKRGRANSHRESLGDGPLSMKAAGQRVALEGL